MHCQQIYGLYLPAMLQGRAVIQRDQDRLEEWVARSLTKLSKVKREVLCCALNNLLHWHMLQVN